MLCFFAPKPTPTPVVFRTLRAPTSKQTTPSPTTQQTPLTKTTTTTKQLVLRAINGSKSAFMAVTFAAKFFESYAVVGAKGIAQAGVMLKHVLAALRTQRISLASFELVSDSRLSVTLECDNGGCAACVCVCQ